jgi:hypothetical protein
VSGGGHRANVDDVDSRAWANVQCGFERRHDAQMVLLRAAWTKRRQSNLFGEVQK